MASSPVELDINSPIQYLNTAVNLKARGNLKSLYPLSSVSFTQFAKAGRTRADPNNKRPLPFIQISC
jgi:hypothetical protein